MDAIGRRDEHAVSLQASARNCSKTHVDMAGRHTYIQTDRQTYRQTYRQTDRQAYRQTDIQTYRQTDSRLTRKNKSMYL